MEEERVVEPAETEKEVYQPRPMWQVWAARVGLVLFVMFVIYQFLLMARGGL